MRARFHAVSNQPSGARSRLLGAVVAACALAAGATLAGGCTPSRKAAVPFESQDRAVVPGLGPGVRTWGAEANPAFLKGMMDSVSREKAALGLPADAKKMPPALFLAISGGGQNGAFGAGVMCGWTAAGTRPMFKGVTGISTGALMAPFVFLGPDYDHVLREVYTKTTTKDIMTARGPLAAIFDESMADTKPLWRLMSKYVDENMLKAIARERDKGRLLLIGTTNLDARRAVLWNVTEIAASGAPNALNLVREILIASAAIPAAFPPVMVDVEVDGKTYQEMHVDGGASTQVFLYPPSLRVAEEARAAGVERERRAYIIRNARLDPDWEQVDRSTLAIAGRAITSLIQTQGIGDLYRIYLNAKRDGIDFNLIFIPLTFDLVATEEFDPKYMTALFDVGFEMGKNGVPWHKTPPLFDDVAGVVTTSP